MRLGIDVPRPLEHQVLEQMRKAGASRLLVLRADVIHKLQMHDWRRMVLVEHNRQAVWKRRDLVLQRWWTHRCRDARRRDRDETNRDHVRETPWKESKHHLSHPTPSLLVDEPEPHEG